MTKDFYKNLAIYFGIAMSVFGIDSMVKYAVENPDKMNPALPKYREGFIFNKNIKLNYLRNNGAALSIFKDNPVFLKTVSVSFVISSAINIIKMCGEDRGHLKKLGMAFILSGGASNTLDRLTKGYVTDYFSINKGKKLRNIVFNISDFAIFLGAIIFSIGNVIDE